MTTFNFNDRASYKNFRAAWKTEYKALTSEIQNTRAAIKQAGRDGNQDRMSILQSHKTTLRGDASTMMKTLMEAKEEARRQYETSHEIAAA